MLEVVEGAPPGSPIPFAKAERMALAVASDGAPTPTEAGAIEVAVTVSVRFAAR